MLICNTENISENNGSGQTIIIQLVVTVTFGLIIIIVITAILVLSILKVLQCSKSRKLCY